MSAPTMTLIATKLGDSAASTQFTFMDGNGSIRLVFVMSSTDTASLNTNVFGGATNATRSFTYGEDSNANLFPVGTAIGR